MVLVFVMKKSYIICNRKITVEAPWFTPQEGYWPMFEAEFPEADINVLCRECESLPDFGGKRLGECGDVTVSIEGGKVSRLFHLGTDPGAMCVYDAFGASSADAYILSRNYDVAMDGRYMWSSLALSQLLLQKDAFLLHASYIEHGGKAILFSAPCGVGKSTQAALWAEHNGSRIINGDKAGVSFDGDEINAGSLPFCGTSGICKNETYPLGAVVLLSRADCSTVRRLGGSEAVLGIMNNIYLDFLAPGEQKSCVDLLIRLAAEVPVLQLSCTPDKSAVAALENALKEYKII